MKVLQRIVLWASLGAAALLAALSIIGAFYGADKASELFNSPPLVVFWFLLAGLLLTGLISFKKLIRSPGLLAAHLGALAILLGAMYGSERGHGVARGLLGNDKIRSGFMVVERGEPTDMVLDKSTRHIQARLPFQLKLEDFWIDYYPPKKEQWGLLAEVWRLGPDNQPDPQQALIDWAVGQERAIPFTPAKVKVLQYLPHAMPVYDANRQAALEVTCPDGSKTLVPAKAGSTTSLADPRIDLRIARVLSHLMVAGKEVVDAPDSAGPAALEIEIDQPGKEKTHAYVFEEGFEAHNPQVSSLKMRYVLPTFVAAKQASEGPPAMEVLLTCDGKQQHKWFVPSAGQTYVFVSLADLTGEEGPTTRQHEAIAGAHGMGEMHAQTSLIFAQPPAEPKAYNSRLTVLENGRQRDTRVVEVNDPLHYGGYHFYQHDYDHEGGDYTVLSVTSDSGLYAVYLGFGLLLVGVFWVFWARPREKGPVSPERATYRIVCLGFPLLTLGLVLGAVWGKMAWGDYWNWDPKELWSLVSWLVFMGYLHWRHTYGQKYPRVNSALAVAGMLAIVITLLWVNLSARFSGMHSYSASGSVLRIKESLLGGLIMGAMGAYALAAVALSFKRRKIGSAFFASGFALALAAIAVRWVEVDHLPLQNLFEVFLFLGMLAYPISLFCRLYLRAGGEVFDAVLGFILLFPAAFVFTAEPQELPPALRSWLFAPHVSAYMLAYVILAKAGVQALGYLFGRGQVSPSIA